MSHPLLNAFWIMLWFFLWILWFMLLFRVFADVFRDDSLNGWGKAGWIIFCCLLPFVGVFVYLIVRGRSMHERAEARVKWSQAEFDDYVRQTAGSTGSTDELAKLADLKSSGALSDAEYEKAKAKILAQR
jgi:hypothetical protein